MRVIMKCYHTTAEGHGFAPGDVAEFDDAEAARQIEIGGARELTEADMAALAALQAKLGPTVEEYVAAGYDAEKYPPTGYESRSTPEQIAAAIEAQKADKKKK